MPNNLVRSALLLCSLLIPLGGCTGRPSPDADAASPLLNWSGEAIEFRGAKIRLGFRGAAGTADRSMEPVANITRDGAPVPGAMVFIALIASSGKASDAERLLEEAPAIYELPTQQTPALYTTGKRQLPDGVVPTAVRFRIVLPEAEEDFTREIPPP
jgi:hypothetical protein